MLRLQCFMAFSVLSDKTSLNSLACNTRTFGKLSLNVRLNIIFIFVKNMQNILWGKCQENTINFCLPKISFNIAGLEHLWCECGYGEVDVKQTPYVDFIVHFTQKIIL